LIAHLSGSLLRVESTYIIIDVHGVGYKVAVPVSVLVTLPDPGGSISLNIHTQVREEEISLFGFATTSDQRVFELLISVTGIGPKVAMSILSSLDAQSVCRIVAAEDTRALVKVPGIGLKTAQRLVLELKDKLAVFTWEQKTAPTIVSLSVQQPDVVEDVAEGLTNLGYNRNDARRAAEKATQDLGDSATMAATLRAALNILTNSGSR
jgi:Holliday junction DNA helicase RuvA